jgi:hypothetical protein
MIHLDRGRIEIIDMVLVLRVLIGEMSERSGVVQAPGEAGFAFAKQRIVEQSLEFDAAAALEDLALPCEVAVGA